MPVSDDSNEEQKSDDEQIFNPYNPANIEITLNDIQSILKTYGVHYKVDNPELYKRAFIHKSYTKRPAAENEEADIKIAEKPYDCLPLKTKSNERLEFVGDGVLELITKYYLYKRFPKADEGFMTEKKIALVKNEHIGKLAYEMKLHKWFIMSKHAEEKNTDG
jgi:dsRNA-specific ribonuclease